MGSSLALVAKIGSLLSCTGTLLAEGSTGAHRQFLKIGYVAPVILELSTVKICTLNSKILTMALIYVYLNPIKLHSIICLHKYIITYKTYYDISKIEYQKWKFYQCIKIIIVMSKTIMFVLLEATRVNIRCNELLMEEIST